MYGPLSARFLPLTLLTAFGFTFATTACATVKSAAEGAAVRATGREVAERVDRTIDAAANGAEGTVMGGEEAEGSESDRSDAEPAANEAPSEDVQAAQRGASAANAGFDFEPGERVLFESSFEGETVGDFPRSLTWRRGNMEVAEWEGQRWVRATSDNAALSIPLPETLPEQFTIEMDIYNPSAPYGMILSTGALPQSLNFRGEPHLLWAGPASGGSGLIGPAGERLAADQFEVDAVRGFERAPVTARVMVDNQHMKLYWGDTRIANVPQVDLPRSQFLHLVFRADPSQPIYIGNIRIAAGGRDLYAVLEREGRFTARGIHFDTGSDRIRPESKPELDEIGAVLTEHADLRLLIEGHTDSEGPEASNLDLSERRAASVRAYLVENYGVSGSRLQSAGFGESRPVDSNESAEGRQMNRRVEIVRSGSEAPSPQPKAVSPGFVGAPDAGPFPTSTVPTQVGAVIGFVEIDDIGRFDVVGAPAGTTRQDALQARLDLTPMAAWIDGQNRFVIVAHAPPGSANQGWVHIDLALATRVGSTTSDLQPGVGETVFLPQTRGFTYHEPGPPAVERSIYGDDMTIEELSQSGDGTWSVRIRFAGTVDRFSRDAGASLGEVSMTGVLEFKGMPVVGS